MTTKNEGDVKFTRAEMRRLWKETKRSDRYKKSGFLDFGTYLGVQVSPSKYEPHIGNKQKQKGL